MLAAPPGTLTQLLRDCVAYRWALDCVVSYLEPRDVMVLTIAALEHGGDPFDELTHWLMDGDLPSPTLMDQDNDYLSEAVVHGCWKAAEVLSLRVQRCEPRSIKWQTKHAAVPQAESALRRVMVAITQSRDYYFDTRVIAAVAARGDLEAVRCMLARHSERYHTSSAFSKIPNCDDTKKVVFGAAIDAGQHHVVDWLIAHWRGCYKCDERACRLSEAYLLEEFARRGEVEMLQTHIHGRDHDHAAYMATVNAARNGHVAVIEWIFRSFRRSFECSSSRGAAERGQFELLEWMRARGKLQDPRIRLLEAAAGAGRLDVVRWLQGHLDELTWNSQESSACKAAGKASELAVVQFFHEECGIELDVSFLKIMQASTTVEFVQYVLDRVAPTDVDTVELLLTAARKTNLEIVKFLVLRRGCWSRDVLAHAIKRGRFYTADSLKTYQFLYAHAKTRANELATSLEDQVNFSDIKILSIALPHYFATAQWLAESVPEVESGDALATLDWWQEVSFPRSSVAQEFILACLRARPAQCLQLKWLPVWAVEAKCFSVFSELVDLGHPRAVSSVMYNYITRRPDTDILRDSRFVLKLLPLHDDSVLPFVVPWAAAIGAERVLNVIDRQWSGALRALDHARILKAALQAVEHGHVGVLQWFHDRALLMPQCELHSGAFLKPTLAQLLERAVKHDRPECVRWLVVTIDVAPRVIKRTLRSATELRSTRVVRWLTHPSTSR